MAPAAPPSGAACQWQRTRDADLNDRERECIARSGEADETPAPPRPVPLPADAPVTSSTPQTLARAGGSWLRSTAIALTLGVAAFIGVNLLQLRPKREDTPPPVLAPPLPEEIAARLAAADQLYLAGKLAEAGDAYRVVLAQQPENLVALLQLGRVLDRNGDFAGSSAMYEQAMAAHHRDPQPYIERADSLSQQQRFANAVRDLDQALQIDPKRAVAFYNRGAAKANMGEVKEAIADYTAAIALDAGDPLSRHRRPGAHRDAARSAGVQPGHEGAGVADRAPRGQRRRRDTLLLRPGPPAGAGRCDRRRVGAGEDGHTAVVAAGVRRRGRLPACAAWARRTMGALADEGAGHARRRLTCGARRQPGDGGFEVAATFWFGSCLSPTAGRPGAGIGER